VASVEKRPAPELGRIAVSEWAETWLASKKMLKGRTYTSYESVWRTLVKPRWSDTRLDRVTHGEVVRWVAELSERGRSPSRITQALLCPKQVLALAVMDGRLARNAAEHVKPPRPRKAEPRFLTHEQVRELAGACGQSGLAEPGLRQRADPDADSAAARPCCAPMVVADTGRLVRLSARCRMSVNPAF